MKVKIESAAFSHKFGNNPEVSVHTVIANGVTYQCWAPSILSKVGQEVEVEIIPAKDPKYPSRIKLITDNVPGGNKWQSKGSFGKSKDELVLSSKTMLLSYCKDIVVCFMQTQAQKEIPWDMVKTGYERLVPILELDKISETPKSAPQEATAPIPKSLTDMAREISGILSVAAFSTWWHKNNSDIALLSPGDKQILFTEKAHKLAELEGNVVSGEEIPF